MLDFLKIVARAKLRTLHHLFDRRYGREQEALLDRVAQQLGLGMARGE